MKTAHDLLLELTSLTQCYFAERYDSKEWIYAESESYLYFKEQALKSKATLKEQPTLKNLNTPYEPESKQKSSLPPKEVPKTENKNLPPVRRAEEVKEEIQTLSKTASIIKLPPPDEEKKSDQFFTLEPLGPPQVSDLENVRKLIAEKFPKLKIIDSPPNKTFQLPKADVYILASLGNTFLANVCQAINTQLGSCLLLDPVAIENEKRWETLIQADYRLLILEEETLKKYPALVQSYQAASAGQSTLPVVGKAPVLVLSDPANLATSDSRKRSLWNTLKAHLLPPLM